MGIHGRGHGASPVVRAFRASFIHQSNELILSIQQEKAIIALRDDPRWNLDRRPLLALERFADAAAAGRTGWSGSRTAQPPPAARV
jgi:hypothetical protein